MQNQCTWTESCEGNRSIHLTWNSKCFLRINWEAKPIGFGWEQTVEKMTLFPLHIIEHTLFMSARHHRYWGIILLDCWQR